MAETDSAHQKYSGLTIGQKTEVYQQLLLYSVEGRLRYGSITKVANACKVSRKTVARIWDRVNEPADDGLPSGVKALVPRRKGRSGRKRIDRSDALARLRTVPLNRRSTIRACAFRTGIPSSSFFRILQTQSVKRVTSAVRPLLTPANKTARLRFCIGHVNPDGLFHDMMDKVHIDEKWFYITKTKRNYYVLDNEPLPERQVKSKKFVTKVMFMAALARPRFDRGRRRMFDGKLGIWPFVFQEPAKRNSKNRPKGTLETKNVASINKNEIKKMLLEKVIPAIKERVPEEMKDSPILIQQDNARPHVNGSDEDLQAAGSEGEWDIRIDCQPPNSPDFNVLDLGFFNTIQSLQQEQNMNSIDDLIKSTEDAYNNVSPTKIDNIFLTLQCCMEASMTVMGGNNYKIPHTNKDKLRREGRLPISIQCNPETLAAARESVDTIVI
jgi:hypothetical protein